MKRKPLHERWLAARNAMRTLPPAGTAPTASESGSKTIPTKPSGKTALKLVYGNAQKD